MSLKFFIPIVFISFFAISYYAALTFGVPTVIDTIPTVGTSSPRDISYEIDHTRVQLVNGESVIEIAPGSVSKTVTRYFGNEVSGDFNKDGLNDIAFLLTQQGGGSGTFYYVAVALRTRSGFRGTNVVLLGDRIAPQTTEYRFGKIIVNYADRKAGEPMTERPSVGVSKYFVVQGNSLVVSD